jgi:hypothetical protein
MTGPAAIVVDVLGVALWTDPLPSWDHAQAVVRGLALPLQGVQPLPVTKLLGASERRRAPETVVLAFHVAEAALAGAAMDAAHVPSVFASAQGDMPITDSLCAALASTPSLLSPTKFMNSVHNAVSGQWGVATGCRAPSTAITASHHSVGAGLMEAAVQAHAMQQPVLWVTYEVASVGTLNQLVPQRGRGAWGMVLAPVATPSPMASRGPLAGLATGEPQRTAPASHRLTLRPAWVAGQDAVWTDLGGPTGPSLAEALKAWTCKAPGFDWPCLAAMAARRHACGLMGAGPGVSVQLEAVALT